MIALASPDGFVAMPDRISGELADRQERASRKLNYHHPFLDDCLKGILPNDLILIGAATGAGKTDLALAIAVANAKRGNAVHYFALEAEPRELERRAKYSLLVEEAYRRQHPKARDMNYTDWLLGECEHVCGDMNATVDHKMATVFRSLWTYYRGASFTASDMVNAIGNIEQDTSLIVVDHLHYVDAADHEDEHRALGDTVKTVRDVSLRIGKPIVLVAHLRKRDERSKSPLRTIDDFHGSSNITKIATQVITLERASDVEAQKWFLAPTYMSILKDRRAGAPRVVAVTSFDIRTKSYAPTYTLGRLAGPKWEELKFGDVPGWAQGHRPIAEPAQAEIGAGS